MADATEPPVVMPSSVTGSSIGLVVTIAAGAFFIGRFSRKEGDSPLPSVTALAMTYVVFRGLDFLWPSGLRAGGSIDTIPMAGVSGIAQAFKQSLNSFIPGVAVPRPASRQTVDGYTVRA